MSLKFKIKRREGPKHGSEIFAITGLGSGDTVIEYKINKALPDAIFVSREGVTYANKDDLEFNYFDDDLLTDLALRLPTRLIYVPFRSDKERDLVIDALFAYYENHATVFTRRAKAATELVQVLMRHLQNLYLNSVDLPDKEV